VCTAVVRVVVGVVVPVFSVLEGVGPVDAVPGAAAVVALGADTIGVASGRARIKVEALIVLVVSMRGRPLFLLGPSDSGSGGGRIGAAAKVILVATFLLVKRNDCWCGCANDQESLSALVMMVVVVVLAHGINCALWDTRCAR
jgi:hypothetical protein